MANQVVVLVRHGETEWSRDGRHTGKTDIPLTDGGRRQAKALGAELSAWQFALVLTSPLARARDTCNLAGYGKDAHVRPELVEWDYGRYEGLTSKQIAVTNPEWSLWRDGGPGGEKSADVGRRVDRVIAEVRGVGALPHRLRVALVAATNDARIVAVLLVLAAVALGFEMAASFHLI